MYLENEERTAIEYYRGVAISAAVRARNCMGTLRDVLGELYDAGMLDTMFADQCGDAIDCLARMIVGAGEFREKCEKILADRGKKEGDRDGF